MTTIPNIVECPKCGHNMIVTVEEEGIFVKGYSKPFMVKYLMFHCPNCMELINQLKDDDNAKIFKKAIEKLCKRIQFVFR